MSASLAEDLETTNTSNETWFINSIMIGPIRLGGLFKAPFYYVIPVKATLSIDAGLFLVK